MANNKLKINIDTTEALKQTEEVTEADKNNCFKNMLRKDKEEMQTKLVTTISKDGKNSVVDQNAKRILIKTDKIIIVGENKWK
ncbi:hypothetical protein [Bacillus toyonensis]|uniref:hypothetical protein n=1 Tax=Bacillus toyonensis TaxID=155322 RepID=UPI003D64F4CC